LGDVINNARNKQSRNGHKVVIAQRSHVSAIRCNGQRRILCGGCNKRVERAKHEVGAVTACHRNVSSNDTRQRVKSHGMKKGRCNGKQNDVTGIAHHIRQDSQEDNPKDDAARTTVFADSQTDASRQEA